MSSIGLSDCSPTRRWRRSRPAGSIGSPTASGRSARAGSRPCSTSSGVSKDGRVGTFAWNTRRHLELYFAAPCSRPRPAHAQHPPVPGRHHLHRQPRRGRGRLRRPLAAEDPLAADRPPGDGQARGRDGRRRRRGDPRRRPDPRLRGAARRRRAGGVRRSSRTRTRPPRCVTRAAPPAIRRASSTRTAARSCTRWARWSPTPPRSRERDTIMPVVPMFHANAWGLCQAAVMAGANLAMPGPEHAAEGDRGADGGREGHARRGRADDLDGRTARAQGPRPQPPARDPVRRLGRPAGAQRALPRADRAADPAGLGHDRDEPGRDDGAASSPRSARQRRPGAGRAARDAGHRDPARGPADRRPGHRRGAAVGRRGARRAAGQRPVDRGRATTTTSARRTPSPRTAGCAPATSPRSARTATSSSSTAPRTS